LEKSQAMFKQAANRTDKGWSGGDVWSWLEAALPEKAQSNDHHAGGRSLQ
jgi:hypothetical protein